MAKEVPLKQLSDFLPPDSIDDVMHYLNTYEVHLTVTRKRLSVLGNYRNRVAKENHRITVNGNLNKFSFLITLLHEIAHLLAFEKYGHRISPHGDEWKKEYAKVLSAFIKKKLFPEDIKEVLLTSLKNPAASSCADMDLIRVLKKHDTGAKTVFVENIKEGAMFKIQGERVFKKGEKMRTRYKCLDVATRKLYLFSAVYEVVPVKE
ncbi:SprT-like domain-containing protein [soil metagenome]